MTDQKLAALVAQINVDRLELLGLKGQDYSGDEDRLGNFKRVSEVCRLLRVYPELSPVDAALFLVILKLDRWTNLLHQGVAPANESLRDTVVDLHNYIDLAFACQQDQAPLEESTPRVSSFGPI